MKIAIRTGGLARPRDLQSHKSIRIIVVVCGIWLSATSGCGRSTPVQLDPLPVDTAASPSDEPSAPNSDEAESAAPQIKDSGSKKSTGPQTKVALPRVSISADAHWLATLNEDGVTRVFDVTAGLLKRSFPSPFVGATALGIDRAGEYVFVGNSRGMVQQLISSTTDGLDEFQRRDAIEKGGRPLLGGHTGPITQVLLSGNEQLLATIGTDGTARIWSRDAAVQSTKPLEIVGSPTCVARRPGSPLVLVGTDRGLTELSVSGPEKVREIEIEGGVLGVSPLATGEVLIRDAKNRVIVLDAELKVSTGASGGVSSVVAVRSTASGYWAVHTDGTVREFGMEAAAESRTASDAPLVTAGPLTGTQWLGLTREGELVQLSGGGQPGTPLPRSANLQRPTALAVSHGGRFSVVGDSQGVANLIALESKTVAGQVTVTPGKRLDQLAVSPGGQFLAATADRYLYLTEWQGGSRTLAATEPGQRLLSTGKSAALGVVSARRNELSLVDLDSPDKAVLRYELPEGKIAMTSPTARGDWLVARDDGQVARLNSKTFAVESTVHPTPDRPVAMMDTGDELFIADARGAVRSVLWEEPEVKRIGRLFDEAKKADLQLVLSADGQFASGKSDAGVVVRQIGANGREWTFPIRGEISELSISGRGEAVAWLDSAGVAHARKIDSEAVEANSEHELKVVGTAPWAHVALGNGGQFLATAGRDGTAWIWRGVREERPITLPVPANVVLVEQSPDGSQVLTVTAEGQVAVGRLDGEKPALSKSYGPCQACWSRDGKAIVVASRTGVDYLNAATGVSEGLVPLAILDPKWLRSTGTGKRYWVGSTDGVVRQVDLAKKEQIRDWPPVRGEIRQFDATSTRLLILTATEAILRDVEGETADVRLPVGPVIDASFSADGSLLAALTKAGQVQVWQILKNALWKEADTRIAAPLGLRRNAKDGWWMVIGQDGQLALVDWQGQVLDRTPGNPDDEIETAGSAIDAGVVVATKSGLKLLLPKLHSVARMSGSRFSAICEAGRYVAAVDTERDLWIWDVLERRLARVVRKLPAEVTHLCACGTEAVAVGLADGTAQVIPVSTSAKVVTCRAEDPIVAFGCDPDGAAVVRAGASGDTSVFDAATGQELESINVRRWGGGTKPAAFGLDLAAGRIVACDGSGEAVEMRLQTRPIARQTDLVLGFGLRPEGETLDVYWVTGRGQLWRFDATQRQARQIPLSEDRALSVRSDGEVVLTSDKAGVLKLIEPGTMKVLARRELGNVKSARFSEDGSHCACELEDGAIEVLSTNNLATKRRQVPSRPLTGYGLVSDPLMLVMGLIDGSIEIVDFRDVRQNVSRQWEEIATAIGFSEDNERLYAALADHSIRGWNIRTGEEALRLETKAARSIEQLLPTPTGLVALASRQLFVWQSLDQKEPLVIRLANAATWMAATTDATRLVVGGAADEAEVFDLLTGKTIATVLLPERDSLCGSWRDGNRFSVLFKSGQVVDRGVPVRSMFGTKLIKPVSADIAVAPGIVAVGTEHEASWFSIAGQPMGRAEVGTGRLRHVTLSPDGRYLAMLIVGTEPEKGRLHLINTADGVELGRVELPGIPVNVLFHEDGKRCLVGLETGAIAAVDLLAARIDELLAVSEGAVHVSAVEENSLLWVSKTGRADVAGLTCAGVISGEDAQPLSLDFCLNDTAAVVGMSDGRVVVWSVANRRQIASSQLHKGPVEVVRAHKTSPLVATGGRDGEIRFWPLEQLFAGGIPGKPSIVCKHGTAVRDIRLDPSAARALSCGTDGTIKVWDLAMGKETRRIGGKGSPILQFAIGPEANHLVGVGEDSYARVWDYVAPPTGKDDEQVRELPIHANREELIARMSGGQKADLSADLTAQLALLEQEHRDSVQRDRASATSLLSAGTSAQPSDAGLTVRRQRLESELRTAVNGERKQEMRREIVRLRKEEELTEAVTVAKSEPEKARAKKTLEEFKKAATAPEESVRKILSETVAEQSIKALNDRNEALASDLRPKLWPAVEYDPQTGKPTHLVAEVRSQFRFGIKERSAVVLNVADDAVFAAAGRESVQITLPEGGRETVPAVIQAWDVPTKTVLRTWPDVLGISLRSLSLSASQDVIFSSPDVRLFDLINGSLQPVQDASAVAISPQSQFLAVGARGRPLETVEVLKLLSGRRLEESTTARSDYEGWALALAWCAEGQTLVASFRDRLRNRLALIDPDKPTRSYLIEERAFEIPWTKEGENDGLGYEAVFPSPGNEYLIATGRTGQTEYSWTVYRLSEMVKMGDTRPEKPLRQTSRLRPFVDTSLPRPAFFVGGLSGKRQTLIIDQGTTISAVRMADQAVADFDLQRVIGGQFVTSFSADGRWLAVGDDAGRVFVLDLVKLLSGDSSLPNFQAHSAPVVGLSFSPSSRVLITAAEDNSIRVWSLGGLNFESAQSVLDRLEQDTKKGAKKASPKKVAPLPTPAPLTNPAPQSKPAPAK